MAGKDRMGRLFLTIILAVFMAGLVSSPSFAGEKKINIRFSTWHVPAGADRKSVV